MMTLQAVLFDMDGVLVDSEEFIRRAAMIMFEEKGYKVKEEDFLPFTGTGENRFLGGVAEKHRIPFVLEKDKARTYAIYEEITDGRLHPLPGVAYALKLCEELKLKTAVCTSADEIKMRINLKRMGMDPSHFHACVFAEMVEHKKPAPDIFLRGARLLKISPGDCLVIEDAPSGLQAARAAGMRVFALSTSFKEKDLALAERIIPDLSFLKREHLIESIK